MPRKSFSPEILRLQADHIKANYCLQRGELSVMHPELPLLKGQDRTIFLPADDFVVAKRYRGISTPHGNVYTHRAVWLLGTGSWPPNDIDHIDGNRQNNRLSNLRSVTAKQNHENRATSSNNTSGFPGVYWVTKRKRWKSQLMLDGRPHFLGYFENKEDARVAYFQAKVTKTDAPAVWYHRHGYGGLYDALQDLLKTLPPVWQNR